MGITKTSKRKYFLSKRMDGFFIKIAAIARFVGNYFAQLVKPPYEFPEIVRQSYKIGCDSLPLISLTGFIIAASKSRKLILSNAFAMNVAMLMCSFTDMFK